MSVPVVVCEEALVLVEAQLVRWYVVCARMVARSCLFVYPLEVVVQTRVLIGLGSLPPRRLVAAYGEFHRSFEPRRSVVVRSEGHRVVGKPVGLPGVWLLLIVVVDRPVGVDLAVEEDLLVLDVVVVGPAAIDQLLRWLVDH